MICMTILLVSNRNCAFYQDNSFQNVEIVKWVEWIFGFDLQEL